MSDNDGPNHFAGGRHNRRSRHHKYGRRHCWPYRILAARHRARHHSAHIVPTIHRLLFLRRRLLMVMMLPNRAVGVRAAIHSMRQQRRSRQRRVQQRHRQHAQACRRNSRPFAVNAVRGHNHTFLSNNTPIRRFSTNGVIRTVGISIDLGIHLDEHAIRGSGPFGASIRATTGDRRAFKPLSQFIPIGRQPCPNHPEGAERRL